jgi:hypothetical protein
MQPPEHHPVNDNKPPKQRKDYALFFIESRGNRSYFRFTPLGVTVIMLLTVVPLILILIIFVTSSRQIENMNINANIPVQTHTPNPINSPVIIQQPMPLPPPKIRQQPLKVPNPLQEPVIINRSEYPTPKPSPTLQNSNRSANYP